MELIDTHTHLYGEEFQADLPEVMERAKVAGIVKLFFPNIDAASIEPMLAVCRQYPDMAYPMLGLHPTEVRADCRQVLQQMHALLVPGHPYIAIGEIGLDFYWDKTFAAEQLEAFDTQVQWALAERLPMSVHARSAHKELLQILSPYLGERPTGVFHCFAGTAEEAAELLAFEGFALGIGGVVTFKKSALPDVLRSSVPLSRIVLETDAPYLAPVPHRGTRNESSYLTDVLEKLAEVYDTSSEMVAKQTFGNTLRLFSRAKNEKNGLK